MVALLDGRTQRTRTLDWKAGRLVRSAWAIDLMRAKLRQRHEKESAIAAAAKPVPASSWRQKT